jgi:hypothetical protein
MKTIIVNALFLIIFAVLHLAARKDRKAIPEGIDKKDNKLYFLYPMANLLLTRTAPGKALLKKVQTSDSAAATAGPGIRSTGEAAYWYGRVSLVLFILLLCNILSLFAGISFINSKGLLAGDKLIRPSKGEGSSKAVLEVRIKDPGPDNEGNEDDEYQVSNDKDANEEDLTAKISITVNEKEYTKEELFSVMDRAVAYLEKAVFGGDFSEKRVSERLNLISEIPGTKIKVKWTFKDPRLISYDGIINNEEASPEGTQTQATAVLSYGDTIREHVFFFTVFPRIKTKEELLTEELNREIEKLDAETSTEDLMKLPDRLGNYLLEYREKRKSASAAITFMGLLAALLAWFMGEKEHTSRRKAINNQMMLDYPDIINKFTLLINAGMTIRQAWIRICEDYLNKKAQKDVKRHAYEEMLVTAHELGLGVNEAAAYEQFGKRTGILPYMKFSTLIVQNLKKGNKGLVELLNREALDAFEERKELAKRMGEEAQTKLLGPMMLMLLLILAIIMIPAFSAFGI